MFISIITVNNLSIDIDFWSVFGIRFQRTVGWMSEKFDINYRQFRVRHVPTREIISILQLDYYECWSILIRNGSILGQNLEKIYSENLGRRNQQQ